MSETPKKTPALKEFESQLATEHTEKYGKAPRGFGQKQETRIERGQPSFGVTDRGKSNDRSQNPHHPGKKPKGAGGGNDREG